MRSGDVGQKGQNGAKTQCVTNAGLNKKIYVSAPGLELNSISGIGRDSA